MSRNKRIDGIYKILPMYEDAVNSPELFDNYMAYLSRIHIRYMGYGNKEIAESIKGLIELQDCVDHHDVHRVVFHMISLLEKEDDKYGN